MTLWLPNLSYTPLLHRASFLIFQYKKKKTTKKITRKENNFLAQSVWNSYSFKDVFSFLFRYTERANDVQTKETILNIDFVLLDCAPLKYAIQGHCQEWQNQLTSLLKELAITELTSLCNYMKKNAERWFDIVFFYFFLFSLCSFQWNVESFNAEIKRFYCQLHATDSSFKRLVLICLTAHRHPYGSFQCWNPIYLQMFDYSHNY